MQTDYIIIINSTLSTNFTEIISIKDNNEKKTKSEKQFIIRVFFDKFRISENLFIRMCDGQTNQRNFLNTEDVSQHLTEISQLNRTHSAKCKKFIKFNSDKLHLLDTEIFF